MAQFCWPIEFPGALGESLQASEKFYTEKKYDKFSSRLCAFWEFYDKFDGANPQVCMEIGRRPRTFCECAFGDEIFWRKKLRWKILL
jgi:hypothetical protein